MILDPAIVAAIRLRYGEESQIARLCESHEQLRELAKEQDEDEDEK